MARLSSKRWTKHNIIYRGALFAAAVALGQFFHPSSAGSPCTKDAPLSIKPFGDVRPCECFSETYLEARTKFRQAAKKRGAQLFQLNIYQNYTTDIAYIPGSDPSSSDLLVHTSGVHGVEGFAGSAIQIALLKSSNQLISAGDSTTSRPSLLLIHAVNPYGMAHFRRFNENNVDLNRNGIHDFTSVLQRDANIAHYVDFDEQFNPTKPFRFGIFVELFPALLEHGLARLKQAMVTGQYHKPTGIFYGGTGLESSNAKLYEFTKTFLDEHPRSESSKTTWINVHTGLGSSGVDTLLFRSINRTEMAKVFSDSLIPGVSGGDNVQNGYDLMQGSTEQLLDPLLSGDKKNEYWLLTQEFGTLPSILVGRALILENMMHHHSDGTSGATMIRNAFYPRTTKWRQAILTQGLRIVQQAMER